MAEFTCAAAGADTCGWKASAESEKELVLEVARHLKEKHDVERVPRTLAKYARAVARGEA